MAQSVQIKSIRAWHEELMDFMLAQPRAGLKETSEYFGVSMSWLSIVKNSDAFQNEWEKKRKLHSSAVSASIIERVEALAEVCLETMTDKLEREGASIGITTLREISETALKSLGFGNRENPRNGVSNTQNNITNNNMIVVDKETLARAREARIRMQIEAPKIETLSLESSKAPESSDAGAQSDSESGVQLPSIRESQGSGDESENPFGRDNREVPLPDSIPQRKPKEQERIFKELFGSDTNNGD